MAKAKEQSSEKKSRKSYTLSAKIKVVKEYKSQQHRVSITKWLEKRNSASEIKLQYSSFKRWVQNYDTMIQSSSVPSKLESKRVRTRPYEDMEKILAEYLSIRNMRLRSERKPVSSSTFIRNKASEFYIDLYGEEAAKLFKSSGGWAHRFQNCYKDILAPQEPNQIVKESKGKEEEE